MLGHIFLKLVCVRILGGGEVVSRSPPHMPALKSKLRFLAWTRWLCSQRSHFGVVELVTVAIGMQWSHPDGCGVCDM